MSVSLRIAIVCLVAWLHGVCASDVCAIDYDEAIQGDLSGNPAAPTALETLHVGTHTLQASFVSGDYDLATFALAPGTRLDSIVLDSYGGSTFSFSGLHAGSTWTTGLGFDVEPEPLLGWILFGEATIGTDILDDYATGADAIGFAPPLPSGVYTLLFQETGPFTATAQFTLNVVPEPSTLAIASFGIVGLFAARSRRLFFGKAI